METLFVLCPDFVPVPRGDDCSNFSVYHFHQCCSSFTIYVYKPFVGLFCMILNFILSCIILCIRALQRNRTHRMFI